MKSALLDEAYNIVAAMYEVARSIETDVLDEKWRTASKLKLAANDAYFYVAQVAGAGEGQSLEFDCINARKYLNTLRAMYIFATKQDMVELEPEKVVSIDKLISQVDAAKEAGQKEIKRKIEEEMEPWLEKYRIWQKMSKD